MPSLSRVNPTAPAPKPTAPVAPPTRTATLPTTPDAAVVTIRLTPPATAQKTFPLVQTVELLENGVPVATAIWFTTGTDGLIQLLDLTVDANHRRRGVGTRLFRVLRKEADLFFRSHGSKLRRITANAEQKSQIVARAWLTHLGFHHVQTLSNTLKNQDVLVYLLGCD